MSWTHATCVKCWEARHPGQRGVLVMREELTDEVLAVARQFDPTAHVPGAVECCWCGALTVAGIYERGNPETLRCKGAHR